MQKKLNFSKHIKHYSLATLALVLTLVLASCSKRTSTVEKKLVIIQTTDIHSHFTGFPNWISLAANIAEARRKAGGIDKTLLIDTGDTLQGSISGAISQGEAGLSMLNHLGYDAWVLGNHDFDFGTARLAGLLKQAHCDIFAANIAWKGGSKRLKSWKLYRKNGLKIAVVGLTSPYLEKWFWGRKLKGLKVVSAMNALAKIMPEVLKAKPDFTILALHHGPYTPRRLDCPVALNVKTIAKRYPQINLILGGHTHQSIPGQKFGYDTWFVEPGRHAEKYAWIEVSFDPAGRRRPTIRSKLVPTRRISKKEYAGFAAPMRKLLDKTSKFSYRTVTELDHPIKPMLKLSAPPRSMARIFCEAMAEAAGTKVAMSGAVNRYAELSGRVTEWNLFSVEPFEDTICVLELNRREFLTIVNEQIKQWRLERPQSVYGVSVEGGWNPKARYHLDTSLRLPNGEKWTSDTKRIPVAFSSYVLASAGGRFPILKKIADSKAVSGRDTGITIRDAIRCLLRKQKR
ncbi:MAG: bifunctional metallophosphatase/5'-nucleotidase [Kiritimatiellaeota bacterium]|nr:bifunctional metallophosphatase/5'-nucleotidase [Kiritimatiellota bacterium]